MGKIHGKSVFVGVHHPHDILGERVTVICRYYAITRPFF
jgi:membrane-associated phospholipid phosphatase